MRKLFHLFNLPFTKLLSLCGQSDVSKMERIMAKAWNRSQGNENLQYHQQII